MSINIVQLWSGTCCCVAIHHSRSTAVGRTVDGIVVSSVTPVRLVCWH